MGAEDPGAYGRLIAGRYDRWYGAREVDRLLPGLLARLAVGGAALEVGVGTRKAWQEPLHQLGVPVVGIDASPEMLARCRADPPRRARRRAALGRSRQPERTRAMRRLLHDVHISSNSAIERCRWRPSRLRRPAPDEAQLW